MRNSYILEVKRHAKYLEENGRLAMNHNFIQHGTKSVYDHCFDVALKSLELVDSMGIRVDRNALIRGALLHDYFLYDWHDPHPEMGLHGFTHAKTSFLNACQDFDLSRIEKDIIAHHMFPLNIRPPKCREAWIVCLADKICASKETAYGFTNRKKQLST